MLLAGGDDGVYCVTDVLDNGDPSVRQVLSAGRALRVRTLPGVAGAFAATTTGLFHSPDGASWSDLGVPTDPVYAVGATPDGQQVFAGTRPAHVYAAGTDGGAVPADPSWRELEGFRALPSRPEWGIERHDDTAQVRDVLTHPAAPDRVVAAVEVGGVHVSDDRGATWREARIEGFDAPHTDDLHHLLLAGPDTFVAATGSGLYRTTDAGRTWTRLDEGHRQSYFREATVHDGTLLAGGSPTPPNGWLDDRDHALFASTDGRSLERLKSPTPDEVVVAWCAAGEDPLGVTNRGTLLHRVADGWRTRGTVPSPEGVHGRCLPLAWLDG